MTDQFAIAHCFASLVVAAYVWFVTLPSLRRDDLRSEVRRIRDGLFDFMWKNGFDFATPHYRDTRQLLNGIIRLASTNLSLATIFTEAVFAARRGALRPLLELLQERDSDDPLTLALQRAKVDATAAVTAYVLSSGAFGLFVRLAGVVLGGVGLAVKAKRYGKRMMDLTLDCAYALGNPNISVATSRLLAGGI